MSKNIQAGFLVKKSLSWNIQKHLSEKLKKYKTGTGER